MQERKGCSGFLGRLSYLFSGKKVFHTETGLSVEFDRAHAKAGNAQQLADVVAQVATTGEGGVFNFNEESNKFEKLELKD